MANILYLHGFASSSDSTKAKLIKSFIKKNTRQVKIFIPDLDNNIINAYDQIEELIKKKSIDALMGSSLGGFYGTYFSEKYDLFCVNINPAVPPIDMSEYLGENKNFSTGEKFIINATHLNFLNSMSKKIKKIKNPKNFLTLLQSGDEVLNYSEAVRYFAGSQIQIAFGGNHSFESFEIHFKKIKNFLNMH